MIVSGRVSERVSERGPKKTKAERFARITHLSTRAGSVGPTYWLVLSQRAVIDSKRLAIYHVKNQVKPFLPSDKSWASLQ